jgi:dTDP-glucose 4,6-dehydratase
LDHANALWLVLTRGRVGQTYNIGASNEWPNIKLVEKICDLVDELAPHLGGSTRSLITFVKDRPGHDRRYAIDASKIRTELGWTPAYPFDEALRYTVDWYIHNQDWVKKVVENAKARLQKTGS